MNPVFCPCSLPCHIIHGVLPRVFIARCFLYTTQGDADVELQRRIYTTFILGTALLNFGTRISNIGHGPLGFCRLKANFSARVPKKLGGPRPPQEVVSARLKRGPRAAN